MTTKEDLDQRRIKALDQVRKSERQAWYFAAAIMLWEVLLVTFIILYVDFGDRIQVLILLSTAVVYGTIGLGLVTLGAYMKQQTLRVIVAIEAGREEAGV